MYKNKNWGIKYSDLLIHNKVAWCRNYLRKEVPKTGFIATKLRNMRTDKNSIRLKIERQFRNELRNI